jgi:hypothetical protein
MAFHSPLHLQPSSPHVMSTPKVPRRVGDHVTPDDFRLVLHRHGAHEVYKVVFLHGTPTRWVATSLHTLGESVRPR